MFTYKHSLLIFIGITTSALGMHKKECFVSSVKPMIQPVPAYKTAVAVPVSTPLSLSVKVAKQGVAPTPLIATGSVAKGTANAFNQLLVKPSDDDSIFAQVLPTYIPQNLPKQISSKNVETATESSVSNEEQLAVLRQTMKNVTICLAALQNKPIAQAIVKEVTVGITSNVARDVPQLPARPLTFDEALAVYKYRPALWNAWQAAAHGTISFSDIPNTEAAINEYFIGCATHNSDLMIVGANKLKSFGVNPEDLKINTVTIWDNQDHKQSGIRFCGQDATMPLVDPLPEWCDAAHVVNHCINYMTQFDPAHSSKPASSITGEDIRREAMLDAYYADRWQKTGDPRFCPDGFRVASTENWDFKTGVFCRFEGTLSQMGGKRPPEPDSFVNLVAHKIYPHLEHYGLSEDLLLAEDDINMALFELQYYHDVATNHDYQEAAKQAQQLIDNLAGLKQRVDRTNELRGSIGFIPRREYKVDCALREQQSLYDQQQLFEGRAVQKERQVEAINKELQGHIHSKFVYDHALLKFWQEWWYGMDPAVINAAIDRCEQQIRSVKNEAARYHTQVAEARYKNYLIKEQFSQMVARADSAQLLQQLKELHATIQDCSVDLPLNQRKAIADRQQVLREELRKRSFTPEQQNSMQEMLHAPINATSGRAEVQQARIQAVSTTNSEQGMVHDWRYAFTPQDVEYLKSLEIDPASLNYFEGNALQKEFIDENVKIITECAKPHDVSEAADYYECAATVSASAIDHAQAGNYIEAQVLTDFAYALVDFTHGAVEQATKATIAGVDVFIHPIDSCKNLVQGVGHLFATAMKEEIRLGIAAGKFDLPGQDRCQYLRDLATQFKQEHDKIAQDLNNAWQEVFKDGKARGCGRIAGDVVANAFIVPKFTGKLQMFVVNPVAKKTLVVLDRIANKTKEALRPLILAGKLAIDIERATPEELIEVCKSFERNFKEYAMYAEKVAGKSCSEKKLLESMGGINQAIGEGISAFDAAANNVANTEGLGLQTVDKVIERISELETVLQEAEEIASGVKADAIGVKIFERQIKQKVFPEKTIRQSIVSSVMDRLPELKQKMSDMLKCLKNRFEFEVKSADVDHVFSADVKETIKAAGKTEIDWGGLHHDYLNQLENEGIIKLQNTRVCPETGVIKTDIIYKGKLIPDKTMFPSGWTPDKILEKTIEALANPIIMPELRPDGKFFCQGITSEGVKIDLFITQNGQITTFYPTNPFI